MKKTPIKRKTALRPSKPLAHGPARLRRSKIKPVNRKRMAKKLARNFGAEAQRVRSMDCLCMGQDAHAFYVELELAHAYGVPDAVILCSGSIVAAHVTPRGMGGSKGDRFRLVPLCAAHHDEAGEEHTGQRSAFEARYGIDLDKEADRIAVEHPDGLGIRGLARRHTEPRCGCGHEWRTRPDGCDCLAPANGLDTYELEALLGWVHREMAREVARRRGIREAHAPHLSGLPDNDSEALAYAVTLAFGGLFTEDPHGGLWVARSLCKAAAERFGRWPS